MAQDTAVKAMQEYMMFSDYEAGIILPQKLDQTVFETALFVDTRDAQPFEGGRIPGAVNIEWRDALGPVDIHREAMMVAARCQLAA